MTLSSGAPVAGGIVWCSTSTGMDWEDLICHRRERSSLHVAISVLMMEDTIMLLEIDYIVRKMDHNMLLKGELTSCLYTGLTLT